MPDKKWYKVELLVELPSEVVKNYGNLPMHSVITHANKVDEIKITDIANEKVMNWVKLAEGIGSAMSIKQKTPDLG